MAPVCRTARAESSSCSEATTRFYFAKGLKKVLDLLPHARTITMLRVALVGSGRTLHEVAKAVCTSPATLSNVANGLYEPSDILRVRLAEYFQVPASRLFRRLSDEMPWLYQRSSR